MTLTSKYSCVAVLLMAAACGGSGPVSQAGYAGPPPAYAQTELAPGAGTEARDGARLTVHYTGWLYDPNQPDNKGQKFDSSLDRNEPLSFTLGKGEVIPGWDVGFTKMRMGGKRRLVIPPALAYGAEGVPAASIPPNAPLVFEMQLLDVK